MKAFSHRAIEMSLTDLTVAEQKGELVFFDRGVVDAAVTHEHSSGTLCSKTLSQNRHYFESVFLAPLWSEIFPKIRTITTTFLLR